MVSAPTPEKPDKIDAVILPSRSENSPTKSFLQKNGKSKPVANGKKNKLNGNDKNKSPSKRDRKPGQGPEQKKPMHVNAKKPGQGPEQKKPVHLNAKKRKLDDSSAENPSKKAKFEVKKNFVANPDKKNFVKNPNKKKFDKNARKAHNGGLSDDRLKAYGINPKKFASSQKYGKNKVDKTNNKPKIKKTEAPAKNIENIENKVKSKTSKSFSKRNALKAEKKQKAAETN